MQETDPGRRSDDAPATRRLPDFLHRCRSRAAEEAKLFGLVDEVIAVRPKHTVADGKDHE